MIEEQRGEAAELKEELAATRGLLSRSIEICDELAPKAGDKKLLHMLQLNAMRTAAGISESVAAIVDKIDRMQARSAISPEQVEFVVSQVIDILTRHVTVDVLRVVSNELRSLRWPAGVNVRMQELPAPDRELIETVDGD